MPKPYPPEFRRRALDLVASGRTVVEVADLLGITQSCLYGWKSRELVDRGLKAGTTAAQSAELAAAHARIRDLEEEVTILRKAAAAVEAVVPRKTGTASSPTWPLTGSGSAFHPADHHGEVLLREDLWRHSAVSVNPWGDPDGRAGTLAGFS